MNPVEVQSYKFRIENSKGQNLNDTMKQIVTLGDFPAELLPSVTNAIQRGEYILLETLCDIMISTKSKDLYALIKSKGLLSGWELVKLFKSGFPSPEIETILVKELYNCFRDNAQPLRTAIVEAMADHGGKASHTLLDVIAYELSPTIIDSKYDRDSNREDIIKAVDFKSLVSFLEKVIGARDRIASRAATTLPEIVNNDSAADNVRNLIKQGESKYLEFKETLSLDVKKNTKEKDIEVSVLKTIVAFLNTEGGSLLVGVNDSGDVTGIINEINKFHKNNIDKFLLHFKNLIKNKIGEQFYPYIDYKIIMIDSVELLLVECQASQSPCYLDKKEFYVRTNPATDKLEGPTLVEYINNHFNKKKNENA